MGSSMTLNDPGASDMSMMYQRIMGGMGTPYGAMMGGFNPMMGMGMGGMVVEGGAAGMAMAMAIMGGVGSARQKMSKGPGPARVTNRGQYGFDPYAQ